MKPLFPEHTKAFILPENVLDFSHIVIDKTAKWDYVKFCILFFKFGLLKAEFLVFEAKSFKPP